MVNPRVFIEISINGKSAGRIIIELFADTTPKTAEKFRIVCTGENPGRLTYKGSEFSIVTPIVLKLGCHWTWTTLDRQSLFGVNPKPENFSRKHDGFGVVSMIKPSGPDFAIALTDLPDYDDNVDNRAQVVVGRVVKGLNIVNAIAYKSSSYSPAVITDCGELLQAQLAPNIATSQNVSPNEFKQVISTSKEWLSNCLKEIMNVNKQLVVADTKGVSVLESEEELVEVASDLEHSCNVLVDLKSEVGSLEKRQKELLSKTEIKISNVKNKRLITEMIPTMSYEELEKFENMIKKRKGDLL